MLSLTHNVLITKVSTCGNGFLAVEISTVLLYTMYKQLMTIYHVQTINDLSLTFLWASEVMGM